MGMSPADMHRAVIEHFGYEAADDVDGVMATLSDDVEHEVIPSPVGKLNDRAKIRAHYGMIFGDLKGESVTLLRADRAIAGQATGISRRRDA